MQRFYDDVFVTSQTLGFDFDSAFAIVLTRRPIEAAEVIEVQYAGDFPAFRSAIMVNYIRRLEANLMDNGQIIKELQYSLTQHMGIFGALQKQLDAMGYKVAAVTGKKKEGIA